MSNARQSSLSRRDVLKASGTIAAATALAGVAVPKVHAAENNTIKLALVGAGGRGTGAVKNALTSKNGPAKLFAMADVFPERLSNSYDSIKSEFASQVDVTEDRRFLGFDAYRHAMDALSPGDVVILTTPPAFRWVHFTYAIEKGLNVFMEKPVTVDGPTSRKMLALAEAASQKNLKAGVGLMCRHCLARQELYQRIKGGEIGDIILLRAYRTAGPTGEADTGPKPEGISELLYQIQRFHAFLWASGGGFSDFLIHNIDECCWMKDAWPIEAKGYGGRHYRGKMIDQNFDTYSVEYTFADGSKMELKGRTMPGCQQEFASFAHGSRGSAVISTSSHTPAHCRIYRGQSFTSDNLAWRYPQPEANPYVLEWDDLLAAIRGDKPYNEVKRGVEASLVTAMGRLAAHTGQRVTYDQMLNHDHEFAPDVDKLTYDSPAPLQLLPNGKYPVPEPGLNTKREYS